MSQTQERKTVQPPIVRSEELIDRMGQNIGSFAALTRQRLQQTAKRAGEKLVPTLPAQKGEQGQPKQPEGKQMGGLPQAEMQRAEKLVDNMGERLGLLTSMVGLQVRKMAAYAREGTEDIVAEAQHIRSARKRVVT